ncbi:MAG TPA: hypothetical protein PLE54_11535 [Burkholderiaceae bacterium]|nr:hypothetical protein [Burkholderiaceae bacterium]
MRDAPLTTIKGGINRLRTKGGARADDLYDFVNGYRLDSGRTRVRPGTSRSAKLDTNTRGLVSFNGQLNTFCHKMVYVPDGYALNLLVRPDLVENLTTGTIRMAALRVRNSGGSSDYVGGGDAEVGGTLGTLTNPFLGTATLPNYDNVLTVYAFSPSDIYPLQRSIYLAMDDGAGGPAAETAFTSIVFTDTNGVERTLLRTAADVPTGTAGGTQRTWTWTLNDSMIFAPGETYDLVFTGVGEEDVEVSTKGSDFALEKIHFAEPFMGALYVAAEFSDGSIFHYWLQAGVTWEASTAYKAGDIVQPTTPNGIVYRATRYGSAYPAWAPSVLRYDGTSTGYEQSVIEPTVYNDFYYTCIYTVGTLPRSGTVEPTWPTEDGATVVESSDNPPDVTTPATTSPPSAAIPSAVTDRYGHWVNRNTQYTT